MPKHILIVEDEESLAFLIEENLTELGPDHTIEICGSGVEALARMRKRPFDLVISDLRMPGMDGLTLLSEIRCLYPDTRLILMTAYGDSRAEAGARQLGVFRYITKPFHIEDLIAATRAALSNCAASWKSSKGEACPAAGRMRRPIHTRQRKVARIAALGL